VSGNWRVTFGFAGKDAAESWMNQQIQHDLWHVERRCKKLRVAKLSAA